MSVRRRADEGSALILVLVIVVVASCMLVPMAGFAVTTLRSNAVVSARNAESEAVKGGLRAALADAARLFETCAGTAPTVLSLPTADGVTTTCRRVGAEVLETDGSGPHPGDHQTWVGSGAPAGYSGSYTSTWTTVDEWQRDGDIWLPDVPDLNLAPRTPPPSGGACRVFYPGAYTAPITINGPAYFASGVYSFSATVTVTAGADVVGGAGPARPADGCPDDAQAAAAFGSTAHGINGLGVTFVLSGAGRLQLDDGSGKLRFVLNQRAVDEGADPAAGGQGVSIITVNGAGAPGGDVDLTVPGRLDVPASAPGASLGPSTVTPHPREPYPPSNVTVQGRSYNGTPVVVVRWEPPATIIPGHEPTGYTATSGIGSCTAPVGAAGCVIAGAGQHTVTVRAHNSYGASAPAAATPVSVNAGGAGVTAPSPPRNVTLAGASILGLVYITPYEDAIVVRWSHPASDGGAPITGYTAQAGLSLDAGLIGLALPAGWVTGLLGPLLPAVLNTVTGVLTAAITDYLDLLDGVRDSNLTLPDGTCTALPTETSCAIPTDKLQVLTGVLKVPVLCVLVCIEVDLSHLLPGLITNLLSTGLLINVTATNSVGQSFPAGVLAGINLLGCRYLPPTTAPNYCGPPPAPPSTYTPTPIVGVDVGTTSIVDVPGYVAVPQGVVRVAATSSGGVTIDGGVLAAYAEITGACTAECRTTFTPDVLQRTIRVTSRLDGSLVTSDAIVQVNSNGAWAINSWVVQPEPSTSP